MGLDTSKTEKPESEKYFDLLNDNPKKARKVLAYFVRRAVASRKGFQTLLELLKTGLTSRNPEIIVEDLLWATKYNLLIQKRDFSRLRDKLNRIINFYFILYQMNTLFHHAGSLEEFVKGLIDLLFHFPEFRVLWGKINSLDTILPFDAQGLKKFFPDEIFEDFEWLREPRILKPSEISESLIEPSKNFGVERWVLIPLGVRDWTFGMLILGLSKAPLSEWERTLFLDDFYNHINSALEAIRERKAHGNNLFDAVTEFPLEGYFLILTEKRFREAREKGEKLMLLSLGVDRLIHVNQVFGFDTGDALLKVLAERLKDFVGKDGEIGRGRSETFYLLVPRPESYVEYLEKLKRFLSLPVVLGNLPLEITLSLGVAFFPEDGTEPRDLLKKARTALHEAKRLGGNRTVFFSRDLHERARKYLVLLPRLRRAIQKNEFVVYCQPRIDAKEWKVCGGEILVRWQDPERGLIPPGEFIWVLEESGLITDLGLWIAEETCRILLDLPREMFVSLNLSFNVSPRQLWGSNFVDRFMDILKRYRLCPTRIKIEITENVFVEKTEEIIKELIKISKTGVKVVLDDFGTGYSSLHYLSRLPVHDLKIDRAFVKGLPNSVKDLEIVKAILALARALGKRVVAEGVETREQLECLCKLGVDEIQGFYFARPLPWPEFKKFVFEFRKEHYI
ncbi:putative bifunctional diguanylate cyclase/phosphodiesterase [Thermosulfurimonas dismutans]|uniref:Sensory box/GGDEF family protein n=1 Tax=Thermosulfurimonas dismutans TaxID=999894 RepID=A0A179D272_9BACT|nr:bifunctional diguanylate cyclase/phosphodiesterase [Thermosulfurimonas dismutans]OAQ20083.1 Sensory box/GGDEF family protein [Thermosulfurimonas dismutans]